MTEECPSSRLKWIFIYFILAFLLLFLFGALTIILIPVPGVLLISHDKRWIWVIGSITIALMVLLIVGAFPGSISIIFCIYALITILFYFGIDRGWEPIKIIFRGTLIGVVVLVLGVGFLWTNSRPLADKSFLESYREMVNQWVEKYIEDLKGKNFFDSAQEQARMLSENKTFIVQSIVHFTPAFLIGLLFFSIFMDYYVLHSLSFKADYFQMEHLSIADWKLNDLLPWAVILGLFFLVIRIDLLKIIAINILIIMAFVYLTQGIAIALFFINKIKMSNLGKVISLVVSFLFFFYLCPMLILFGFADTWMDFRKIRVKIA